MHPWQQQQWQHLISRITHQTLPHALLFKGPSGLGKSSFALSLATLLLCERSQQRLDSKDEWACGICKACQLVQAGNHPDLYLLQPNEDSKVIKIEQIREIIAATAKKSHQNGYQVIIIDPANSMHLAASNALLKTLEEPSENVVFILVTNRPSSIPATIRSRCQLMIFNTPTKSIAKTWLQQQNTSIENIDLLLSLTENAPLSSLYLAQNDRMQQRNDLLKNLTLLLKKQLLPLKFAAAFINMDPKLLLMHLHSYFMDLLRLKFNLAENFIVNSDQIATLNSLGTTISTKKILSCLDKITTLSKYADYNLNQQLMLEDLGILFFSVISV
jgi:DNA polymerase III subunit delta'